jgi:hypothetical protein
MAKKIANRATHSRNREKGVIEKHGPHKQQETLYLPLRREMMIKNLGRKGQQQRRDCHRGNLAHRKVV